MRRETNPYARSDKALREIREVSVMVAGKRRTFDVVAELSVSVSDEKDLSRLLSRHPLRVAFWNLSLAEATRKRARLEAERENLYEEVYGATKDLLRQSRSKVSDREVVATVRTDSRIERLNERIRKAQHRENQLRAVAKAFDHRQSVLMKMYKGSVDVSE